MKIYLRRRHAQTATLLNGWILPIGGVALEWVCVQPANQAFLLNLMPYLRQEVILILTQKANISILSQMVLEQSWPLEQI